MATKVKCNVENVTKLADALETGTIKEGRKRVGFNMNLWLARSDSWVRAVNWKGRRCDTVACIGGSAELLFQKEAHEALGISVRGGDRLFYPNRRVVKEHDWWRIPPAAAVEVLRHLAATGEVDWDRAIELHPLAPSSSAQQP